jgi:hypothetical protein
LLAAERFLPFKVVSTPRRSQAKGTVELTEYFEDFGGEAGVEERIGISGGVTE